MGLVEIYKKVRKLPWPARMIIYPTAAVATISAGLAISVANYRFAKWLYNRDPEAWRRILGDSPRAPTPATARATPPAAAAAQK